MPGAIADYLHNYEKVNYTAFVPAQSFSSGEPTSGDTPGTPPPMLEVV